jgi:hypothetical protein
MEAICCSEKYGDFQRVIRRCVREDITLATLSLTAQFMRSESVQYIASNATVIGSGESWNDVEEVVMTSVNVLPQYFSSD